ncbi:MAG: putative membrane protein [Candidatus Azotimanducaceae bacterium]|jgi:uncharacterized membrane protein
MKKIIVAGLLLWIPLVITLWFFSAIVDLLDNVAMLLPDEMQPEEWLGIRIPGFGVLVTIGVIVLTGFLTANVVGEKLVGIWQKLISSIPILSSVYDGVRQISDTLLSPDGKAFRRAVLVPWPNESSLTIGFVTGEPGTDLQSSLKGKYLNIYVPSTPNPTGGYYVLVPVDKIKPLDMDVETALRYVVSMGVATSAEKS